MAPSTATSSSRFNANRIRRHLTEQQAAETLGVSHRTLQQWRRTGRGPPYLKLGSAVRYDEDALDAWAQAQTRRHTSDPGPRPQGAA